MKVKAPEIRLDIEALKANFETLSKSQEAKAPRLPLMPVVKADAYGHGAVLIARALEAAFSEDRLPYFCVARWSEASELREAGVLRPILVLSQYSSEEILKRPLKNISLLVASPQDLRVLDTLGGSGRQSLRGVHVHFNTGMNRLGFSPHLAEESLTQIFSALASWGLCIEGSSTHLARAEEDPVLLTKLQMQRFDEVLTRLKSIWNPEWGAFPRWIHAANSAGLLRDLGPGLTLGRPGLFLWGVHQDEMSRAQLEAEFPDLKLHPVLSMRCALRELSWVEAGEGLSYGHRYVARSRRLVGILNVGYADGVSRSLSRAEADASELKFLIEGHAVPILGTVTMDMILVDMTDHPKASEIELGLHRDAKTYWADWICPQQPVERHAGVLGTISYEILCDLGHRVKRSVL